MVLYTRVLRHKKLTLNKSDDTWNIDFNTHATSLEGNLFLFEDPAAGAMVPAFGRNSEFYYNPLITKVQTTVEGIPNQIYAQGMLPYQQWDEIVKGFVRESRKDTELSLIDLTTYYRNQYALWLDFRSCDDQTLHGSGRHVKEITLHLNKTVQADGPLFCFVYRFVDAQLNNEDSKFISAVFYCTQNVRTPSARTAIGHHLWSNMLWYDTIRSR